MSYMPYMVLINNRYIKKTKTLYDLLWFNK
jgi:hypothetical protein